MTTYRPVFVSQFDGSAFASGNCTMASAAMALDRQTLGHTKSSGGKMRSCQDDKVGGTDLSDAAVAFARCYNQPLWTPGIIPFQDFIRAIRQGRGAVITGRYGNLDAKYRHQANFFDGHAMYVNEVNDAGWLYNYDPIADKPQWIPASQIKKFAGGINGVGFGRIYVAFTKITGAEVPHTHVPTPLPHPVPHPTPSEGEPMIAEGGLTTTSSHVMSVKKGQEIFGRPHGKVITKMSVDADLPYFGVPLNSGWRCVKVTTGNPYADKVRRPTLAYVPASAGKVTRRGDG
jgi:hypothetical protein